MVYRKSKKTIQQDTDKIIELIEKRGHIFIEGECLNGDSTLIVYCPKHDKTENTNFSNYKRSRTGLRCCGIEQVREKLTNRSFSEKTRKKMSESALDRPARGGKPRKWRETAKYWDWKDQVLALYNNQCSITGKSKSDDVNLEVHHLYSVQGYSDLTYQVENGIILIKELHKEFHMQYGYGLNTISQFQDFLLSLLDESMSISSQANSEELEGSETRAYDPERVMKLHERLEEIKQRLAQI